MSRSKTGYMDRKEYEDRRIYYLYVSTTKELVTEGFFATMKTTDGEVAREMYSAFAEAGFHVKLSYLDTHKEDVACTEDRGEIA